MSLSIRSQSHVSFKVERENICSSQRNWKLKFHSENAWKIKKMKCFPSQLLRRNLKTPQSPAILGLCLCYTGTDCITIIVNSSFSKRLRCQNVFNTYSNARLRFQILQLFFSWLISVTRQPKRREKVPFSNLSSGVVSTGPKENELQDNKFKEDFAKWSLLTRGFKEFVSVYIQTTSLHILPF